MNKLQTIINRDKYVCQHCGKQMTRLTVPHLGHRISLTVPNLKKYGVDIISHSLNAAIACSEECADALCLDTKTDERERFIDSVLEAIDKGYK